MNLRKPLLVFLFFCATCAAEDTLLMTRPAVNSPAYDEVKVKEDVVKRIRVGVYDGQTIDLCNGDSQKCEASVFDPYKTERDGKKSYTVLLSRHVWPRLPQEVQQVVVRAILYDTWGNAAKLGAPLDVSIRGTDGASALDLVSPHAREMYLRFGRREYLAGALGSDAYGPNCWYNAIAAIVDEGSSVAKKQGIVKASWGTHRFMGPAEFRFHVLGGFEKVDRPEAGDLVRYYTDDLLYSGMIFSGEIHGAVYVGREEYSDKDGKSATREIVLTKNGRDDLNFLQFQDLKAMDEIYLAELPKDDPLLQKCNGKDPRKKGYFRVKPGAKILDPAVAGKLSDSYPAYLIDQINLKDRMDCLAGKIDPPSGDNTSAYSYPQRWLTIKYAE